MKKEPVKTITLKVSENTMNKMNEYFEDKKRLKTPPYAVFQADEADTVVTLYQSGKVVFQGISADIDANLWSQMEKNLNPDKKVDMKIAGEKKKETKKNSKVYYANTIGSDEVGTGDFFGPIVVTASYVTKENIPFLENLGVKDSKKLTDEQILKITPQIIKKIPYYTMTLSNKEYNEKHTTYNMNAMKAILHNKVLYNLINENKFEYDYIVVDQFESPKSYFNHLNDTSKLVKDITFITKAEDKCLSVACSSLISRYIFIKEIDKLSDKYGLFIPKGASSYVDDIAIKLINKYGNNVLENVAKLNFSNTDRILKLKD